MSGAGETLQAAAIAALGGIEGLNGAYPGPPLQAVLPYATIEPPLESDWGHKSGAGRELRLTIVLHDGGERPARLQALLGEAEAALAALEVESGGWRLVSLVLGRSRLLPPRKAGETWVGVLEFRARMLAA